MDTCVSKLDYSANSSHYATGPMDSAPRESIASPIVGYIAGPFVGYWRQKFGDMKNFILPYSL